MDQIKRYLFAPSFTIIDFCHRNYLFSHNFCSQLVDGLFNRFCTIKSLYEQDCRNIECCNFSHDLPQICYNVNVTKNIERYFSVLHH